MDTLTPLNVYANNRKSRQELRKFNTLYRYISKNHIDTLDSKALIESAIEGMLNECDPYSIYLYGTQSDDLHHQIEEQRSIESSQRLNDSTIYLKLSHFGRGTVLEFITAVDSLGDNYQDRIILDLRGNCGGLFTEALGLTSLFLPSGVAIVERQDRRAQSIEYSTTHNGKYLDRDLTILIDSTTASASEIVAATLQEFNRALIVGEHSQGKGLILREIIFKDGTSALIAIAQYITPKGSVIQRSYDGVNIVLDGYRGGIKPDISHNEIVNSTNIELSTIKMAYMCE